MDKELRDALHRLLPTSRTGRGQEGGSRSVQLPEGGITPIHQVEEPNHLHRSAVSAVSVEDKFDVLGELFIASVKFWIGLSLRVQIREYRSSEGVVHDFVLPHSSPWGELLES
jgi:hypothetical protein